MWRLGFFFHEMAFGLLSVFLPLYVVAIGGSLVDVGIMTSAALFAAIPFAFLWGYLCDKTRRYKRYILLSFASSAVLLYAFTLTASVGLFIVLYGVMAILHVAHEAPKNVLIAEQYSREEWARSYAFYEGFTKVGWLIGLLLGSVVATFGFEASLTLLVCSGLNVIASLTSLFLVADPLFVFERKLVGIERTMGFTYRGLRAASKILDGGSFDGKLRRDNLYAFGCGLILFAFAARTFSTSLPIFLSNDLALPTSMVFLIYVLNSGGGVVGYVLAGRRSLQSDEKPQIGRIVLFRGALIFLFIVFASLASYAAVFAAAIWMLMGLAYALYYVLTLLLSMERIPAGQAGLFNVLVSVGAACGSFLGPFLAQTVGFMYQFLTAGILFCVAYVAFRIFSR
jgi:MFS family permease